ncbi:MAG: hypothetical protein IT260_14270 [Saprospiraceae bacterium]|nr:hypothetical protein [Saprospiraceae bacterium]
MRGKYFLTIVVLLAAFCSGHTQTAPVSLLQMDRPNVLYLGIDNPVTLHLPVANWDQVQVAISEGTIRREQDNHFVARVNQIGQVAIVVTQGGNVIGQFALVAKRVPDPLPSLNGTSLRKNTSLTAAEFKETRGLGMMQDGLEVDGHCRTVQYTITRIDATGARSSVPNLGARYEEPARKLVAQAVAGDIFLFSNLEANCAGDTANRPINNYVILIK